VHETITGVLRGSISYNENNEGDLPKYKAPPSQKPEKKGILKAALLKADGIRGNEKTNEKGAGSAYQR